MYRIIIQGNKKYHVRGSTRFHSIHLKESISYSRRMRKSSSSGSVHSTGFAKCKLLIQNIRFLRLSKNYTHQETLGTSIGLKTHQQLQERTQHLLLDLILETLLFKMLKLKMELINHIQQSPDHHQHHSLE